MPRKTRYAGQDLTTLGGRVEFVLRELYHGDQSKMSAETGVSQPQISLVARGERSPGPRFLASLVRDPRINVEWLRMGAGQPFAPEPRMVPAGGLSLPVYRDLSALTSGGVDRRPGLHLTIEDLFSPSMCLIEVQAYDPIVNVPEPRIESGDLLVMETDRAAWERNPRSLVARLVVVALRGSDGSDCQIARIESSPDTGRLVVKIFGIDTVAFASSGGEPGAEDEAGQTGCTATHASPRDRKAELSKKLASRKGRPDLTEKFATLSVWGRVWEVPSIDDVVAICVFLIRHRPRVDAEPTQMGG